MDAHRALRLVGLTGLMGALPFVLCSPPVRPAVHHRANMTQAAVVAPLWAAPEARALPDVTADVPVEQTRPHPDCMVLRCVALTFDDGPGPDTERLLGMLAAANVRATFFVMGQSAVDYPDAVRAELAQGEEVGDHTWSHPLLTRLDNVQVADQFARTSDEIAGLDGRRPTLFRPPYGGVNARVNQVIGGYGAPLILWSVDPADWLHRDADQVYDRVTSAVQPGSLVLLHDVHSTTVDAVPRIIDELKARGYTLVTVSQLYGGTLQPGVVYGGREREWAQSHPFSDAALTPPAPAAPATNETTVTVASAQ